MAKRIEIEGVKFTLAAETDGMGDVVVTIVGGDCELGIIVSPEQVRDFAASLNAIANEAEEE